MKEELTDTQIALIIMSALEFNASVIALASQIYGQDIKPKYRERAAKEITELSDTYTKMIREIVNGSKKEEKS